MRFDITTALLTPMIDNKIDYNSLDKLIDIQLQAGITQLVALGSTAETQLLTPLEKWRLLAHIRKQTAGKCTLLVGVGSSNTATTVKDAIKAYEYGADSLLIVTPYYTSYTEQGLNEHYGTLHTATPLPITLYNVPSRTGKSVTAKQAVQLHKLGYIYSIKECSQNTTLANKIANLDKTLPIYCGNDNLIPQYYRSKMAGAISVLSNVFPAFISQCHTTKLYHKILQQLTTAMSHYPNPVPIKYIAHQLGIISSPEVRLPLTTIPPSDSELHKAVCKYKQYLS